jgi:hypothetical protein
MFKNVQSVHGASSMTNILRHFGKKSVMGAFNQTRPESGASGPAQQVLFLFVNTSTQFYLKQQ